MSAEEPTARFRSHWAANVSDVTPHTQPKFIPPPELQSDDDKSWIKKHDVEPPLDFSVIPEEDMERTIVVTNIDPEASNARVLDFLAFAGRVHAFGFGTDAQPGQDGSRERHGFVTYDEVEAFKTALLFSGARLLSTNVSIAPYSAVFGADGGLVECEGDAEEDEGEEGEPVDANSVGQVDPDMAVLMAEDEGDSAAPHESRSKRSILAMILAAGFVVSAGAVAKAKAADEGTLDLADKSSRAYTAVAAKARKNAAARGLGSGISKVRYVMGSALSAASSAVHTAVEKAGLGGFMSKVSASASKLKAQTKDEISRRRGE